MVEYKNLPPALLRDGLFCVWKYENREGKPTKVPYNPRTGGRAQSTNPATFAPLDTALAVLGQYDGLGVGIFGHVGAIDIDHCIDDCIDDNGELSPLAFDVMDTIKGYTEYSPSGHGLRILFKAAGFQYDKARYYINNQKLGLEIYIAGCTNKFVTVTGNALTPGLEIEEHGEQLAAVLEKYMVRTKTKKTTPASASCGPVELDDVALIEKAKKGRNGEQFAALWAGDTSSYQSQSEADMALCNWLAWWTNKDAARMDRLFRSSGLMREKWDRRQSGSTYGAITIQEAIASCSGGYDPQTYFKRTEESVAANRCNHDIKSSQKNVKAKMAPQKKRIGIDAIAAALQELGISLRYNQLLKEAEVLGLPGCYSCENATNILPIYLMDYLRACGYLGVTQQAVDGCLSCIADQNRYNPIREFLSSGDWDGEDRFPEIYRILGVESIRHQTYITKWFMQCVALGLNDESHPVGADGVLVLQGDQGLAKTSFFRIMSPFPRWFVEGAIIDMSNKDTIITALSGWITELGELDSTLKKEQMSLKAFITRPEDRIRTPYSRNDTRSPRRTSFCGTVNPKEYLKDETGSRRFWTVPVTNVDKKALFALDRDWVKQVWLQTHAMYQADPNGFRLVDEEIRELQADNREFDAPLPYELEIRELLDYSLPVSQWEWWRTGELARLMPGNADAGRVGRALQRIKSEIQNAVTQDTSAHHYLTNVNRLWCGYSETLLPLRHFSVVGEVKVR